MLRKGPPYDYTGCPATIRAHPTIHLLVCLMSVTGAIRGIGQVLPRNTFDKGGVSSAQWTIPSCDPPS